MPDTAKVMQQTWTQLEHLLSKDGRDFRLRPPATDAQIEYWQSVINIALPEDIRASFQHHDGQELDGENLIGEWSLLSIQDSIKIWDMQNRLFAENSQENTAPSGTPTEWDRSWIPFATNGLGDHIIADLSTGADKPQGRLIIFRHETTDRLIVAESFATWLQSVEQKLKLIGTLVALGGTVTSAVLSMTELMDLVGYKILDRRVRDLLSSQVIDHRMIDDDTILSGVEAGFDITCQNEVIGQIDFYFTSSMGRSRFGGKMIRGINSGDNRLTVREKLGAPLRIDKKSMVEFNPNSGWDVYQIGKVCLQFTFRPEWNGFSWVTAKPAE
jgi:cell wall assembly regulator SMI1